MKKVILILVLSYACNISNAQSHWESIIMASDTWHYLPAISEPPAGWNQPGFDDGSWQQGPGGIGYSDGDDATLIDPVNSLYLRRTFSLPSDTTVRQLLLDIDYDDAFVAYLNGIEIARSVNVTDVVPFYNSTLTTYREALVYAGGVHERYYIDTSLLQSSENILAVHILNQSILSSDLTSLIYLHGEIEGEQQIFSQPPEWFSPPVEFNGSRLPVVVINTSANYIPDEPRVIAHMGIINNGSEQLNHQGDPFNEYDGSITIETRGQSSQMFPKKSYRLETQDSAGMNLNVSLLGMPAENDWILYAPYSDKSMLRNVMTFEMGRDLDFYSSSTAYCELFLNGAYQGVYVLMEKIKRDDGRVNIARLEPHENSGDELTGGYIFKVDKVDPDYAEGIDGFKSDPDPSYPNAKDIIYQYYDPRPDELTPQQRTYLKKHILEAEAKLISSYFADPDTGYNQYLNTSSFVDFMLLNEVTKEVDKYRYSSYFYKKKESWGGEIYAGPPWDFNLGYGNVNYWEEGLNTANWLFKDVHSGDWSIIFWWKRLMEDPFFEDLAATRWEYLRNTSWSDENIQLMIDSITGLIDEAQQRNYEKWPILGVYVWPNYDWMSNTYADEIDYFRNWLFDRLYWMDDHFYGNILNPDVLISNAGTSGNGKNYRIKLLDDRFTNRNLRKEFFNFITDNSFLLLDSVYYEDATTARIVVAVPPGQSGTDSRFSIQIDDQILNGFRDLETEEILLGAPTDTYSVSHQPQIYAMEQSIIIKTDHFMELPDQLNVYSLAGRLLQQYSIEKSSYNEVHTNLQPGLYIVGLESTKATSYQKIIIH